MTTLLIISAIHALCCSEVTATYCSLDRMKKFAMEACEHLFEFESLEVREKRSIFTGRVKKQDVEECKYNSRNLISKIRVKSSVITVNYCA